MSNNMKNWQFLTGDVNWEEYGGTWCRKAKDGSWWVLRFENCAEWGDGATGYSCEVLRVDLKDVPDDSLQSALGSCGYLMRDDGALTNEHDSVVVLYSDDFIYESLLLDACVSHGIYAPMDTETGESYPLRVRASARRSAEVMMNDDADTALRLKRKVNALGATAQDFGRGDPLAGLRKKVPAVMAGTARLTDAEAIVLKMYAATGGHTLGGKRETKLAVAGIMVDQLGNRRKKEVDDEA